MPNYKVGDVASLFPTPESAKNEKSIQSLFDQYNSRRQNVKSHFKNKAQKNERNSEVADTSVPESKANKKQNFSNKNKRTKKEKKSSQNISPETNTDSSQKITSKKRKLENIENDLKETENPLQIKKRAKKLEKVPIDVTKPVKKQKKKKLNKSDDHNKSHEDLNESNNDGIDTKEINSKEKDELRCTLFVGNLPLTVNRKELHKLFCPFGLLKTVRVRGAIPCKSNIPKKIAEITNKYHKGVHSHKGFVVFKDRESAEKALALNGTLLDNHHIIVDFATNVGEKKTYDEKLSIFVGNLPFDVSDEAVWSAFQECGDIQAVRIIRDRNSGVGKGFGYILFQNSESKQKALALEELQISGRKIRIKPVESNTNQKRGSREALKTIRKNVAIKRFRDNKGKKSVKKLLKKGRRIHRNKQVARMLGEKFVK